MINLRLGVNQNNIMVTIGGILPYFLSNKPTNCTHHRFKKVLAFISQTIMVTTTSLEYCA